LILIFGFENNEMLIPPEQSMYVIVRLLVFPIMHQHRSAH